LVRPGFDDRRIKDIRARLAILQGTLEECGALKNAIAQFAPDLCIHLAWQSPGKLANDESDRQSLAGSLRLLDIAQCDHFVMAGTYTEYCSSNGPVSEDSPLCPSTFYAKCKRELEINAELNQQKKGGRFCSLRIFNVYGPWDNERRMIPSIISSIKKGELCQLRTGGQQIRDFTHVEDVANAICLVAGAKLQGIVNVGSSVATSAASVARLVAQLMGHPELLQLSDQPLPTHEAPILVSDTTRLRREAGWSPKFDLRNGLQQTVQWHSA